MSWLQYTRILVALTLSSGSALGAPLKPGPVSAFTGARLGESIVFENEISSARCYPLITKGGLVLIWISDLHQFDSRVLVRRCVEYDPSVTVTTGARHGDGRVEWEEIHFRDGESISASRDLELPGYQYFSNPTLCAAKIAYWTQSDDRWSVTIYDLKANRPVSTEFVRTNDVETDDQGLFEAPVWDDACTKVTVKDHPSIGAS